MLNALNSLILVVSLAEEQNLSLPRFQRSRCRMDERSEMKYINKRTNERAPDWEFVEPPCGEPACGAFHIQAVKKCQYEDPA